MTANDGLDFLRRHQPLPDDRTIDQQTLTMFDEVRKYFKANPDPRCIPLFLNSFGNGSGFGVYQLVDEVFVAHRESDVISHLHKALIEGSDSARYWAAEICTRYDDPLLVQPLISCLNDESSPDLRAAAAIALSIFEQPEVIEVLRARLAIENDDEVQRTIDDVLNDLLSS